MKEVNNMSIVNILITISEIINGIVLFVGYWVVAKKICLFILNYLDKHIPIHNEPKI